MFNASVNAVMADYPDYSDLFGHDDWSLCPFNDGSASGHIRIRSSNIGGIHSDLSRWELRDTINPTFDTSSSAPAVTSGSLTSVWESPPVGLQQHCLAVLDDTSPKNGAASVLLDSPMLPSQQQEKLRHSLQRSDTRRPAALVTRRARKQLHDKALPPHLPYKSTNGASSPRDPVNGDENGSRSSFDNLKSSNTKVRKRKVSEDPDDDKAVETGEPLKKSSHRIIEKKYRNNLNEKIVALRDAVPSLRIGSKSVKGDDTVESPQERRSLTPTLKINKATVLSKAAEYINHLEQRCHSLQEEHSNLHARIAAFEMLLNESATGGPVEPIQN